MLPVNSKGLFPVELLSLENPSQIEMHANCDTQSLIVYLRELMKKATVAAKRCKCRVGGEIIGRRLLSGKRELEGKMQSFDISHKHYRNIWVFAGCKSSKEEKF